MRSRPKALNAGMFWGAALVAGLVAYRRVLRPKHMRWGATDAEVAMALPGDDIVSSPDYVSTRAIDVWAAPEDIWPWLVQMGEGRGGLYSYDWLDRAFHILSHNSAEVLLPDRRELHEGDLIPIGTNDDPADDFYVHRLEPNRALVIGSAQPDMFNRVSWAIVLRQTGPETTRLIMRVRTRFGDSLKDRLSAALMDPPIFIMLRKQMLNLRRLSERTHEERVKEVAA